MYRVIGHRMIHDGWGRFLIARVEGLGPEPVDREIEDHGEAVAVLPYDPQRRVALLVEQPRAPLLYKGEARALLEAPAGGISGEAPEDCARREALEECGVRLSTLEPAGAVWSMPGVSTERVHLFLAPYGEADKVGPGGGLDDEQEQIEVREVALAELARAMEQGEVRDMKTLLLLLLLRQKLPGVFG
jgi:nudix-type nucleoside diphosphatase (YffH/AdpP family)